MEIAISRRWYEDSAAEFLCRPLLELGVDGCSATVAPDSFILVNAEKGYEHISIKIDFNDAVCRYDMTVSYIDLASNAHYSIAIDPLSSQGSSGGSDTAMMLAEAVRRRLEPLIRRAMMKIKSMLIDRDSCSELSEEAMKMLSSWLSSQIL
ncbi:MAG: hypothetical protein QXQ96_10510 [Sulfolobales archaeon]